MILKISFLFLHLSAFSWGEDSLILPVNSNHRFPLCAFLLKEASSQVPAIPENQLRNLFSDWDRKDLNLETRQRLTQHFEFDRKVKGWELNSYQTEHLLKIIFNSLPLINKEMKARRELRICFLLSNVIISCLISISQIPYSLALHAGVAILDGFIQFFISLGLKELAEESVARIELALPPTSSTQLPTFSLFSGDGKLQTENIAGLEFFPTHSKAQFDFIIEREGEKLSSLILLSAKTHPVF